MPIGDGFANHPEKHRAYGLMPKSFGTFPLVLGSYVRDRGVLTLEEGDPQDHRRARPAPRARRSRRARPGAGRRPRRVRSGDGREPGDRGRTRPHDPAGIERVMVNGAWAVIGGRATGERAGLSL